MDVYVAAFAVLFSGTYLAWQAMHGGIESHHLLDQRSLPALSNAWGLVIFPLIGWLAGWSVQRRAARGRRELPKAVIAATGACLVGLALAVSFLIDPKGNASSYIFFAAIASGIVLPTYRAEYVFGFAIGMSAAFGLVLPAIVSIVPVTLSAVVQLLLRPAFVTMYRRITASIS